MVRTVRSHHEQTNGSSQNVEGESGDRKDSTLRLKHSEAEQRRRCKINERFQMLRQLIPEKDEKRDKASFLLEVIHYIQFLQEKVQMYEGMYQGWSPDPSKLIPSGKNCRPVESFIDQSQLIKNRYFHEGNIVATPAILTPTQNSIESDFSGKPVYKATDNGPAVQTIPRSIPLPTNLSDFSGKPVFKATDHGPAAQTIPFSIPLPTNLFEDVTPEPPQCSFSDAEHLASQSQSPCPAPSYTLNERDELKIGNGAAMPNAYAHGWLNTITQELESSGVDLSQTSISVELDVGKHMAGGMTSMPFSTKDHKISSPNNQARPHYGVGSSNVEDSDRARKRLRTEQSQ